MINIPREIKEDNAAIEKKMVLWRWCYEEEEKKGGGAKRRGREWQVSKEEEEEKRRKKKIFRIRRSPGY